MQTTVFLHEAQDAENSYALSLAGDSAGAWRAEKGFGQKYRQVWSIEFQSGEAPPGQAVDWEKVLTRAIEAYSMNDPVITNYTWPLVDWETRARGVEGRCEGSGR